MGTDSAAAEPSPQTEGYLILLRPEHAYADYAAEMDRISPDRPAHDAWWRNLLELLQTRPQEYAGWDRAPVGRALSDRERAAWPEQRAHLIASLRADPAFVPESLDLPRTRAEQLMTELLGEDPTTRWNVGFLSASVVPDLTIAKEVLSVTPVGEYELVLVRRVEEGAPGSAVRTTAWTLGFEVGTWGGPFSLISDTMLYPRWHPADDEALPDLRRHAARLNANMLFSTFAEAAEFRSWYRTQGWSEAEGEPGDFCIARIDRVAT